MRTRLHAVVAMVSVTGWIGSTRSISAEPPTPPATQPATMAAVANPLDAISWAVGEWRLDAKWANGNPITARATYALGPGGRYIVATTWVDDPAKPDKPLQRDIVIYTADAGRLTQHTFPHDGPARVVRATPTDDGTILFEWIKTDPASGKTTPLRQRLTRLSDGQLRWQAMMQLKGEWHTALDGEWKRKE